MGTLEGEKDTKTGKQEGTGRKAGNWADRQRDKQKDRERCMDRWADRPDREYGERGRGANGLEDKEKKQDELGKKEKKARGDTPTVHHSGTGA